MTALLVDGNNLAMRSVFGSHGTGMSADGVVTGPLVIFVNSLSRHVREEKPDHLGVAWDGGKSTARVALDAGYKANRVSPPEDGDLKDSSFALIKQFLALANIQQALLPGYEADDVIAAWWRCVIPQRGYTSCYHTRILSSDKDFLQLVGRSPYGSRTELIRLSSSNTPTDRWDEARMVEELGYTPEEWPFITALTGDKSDNVIGVPGIGPVKALKLLRAHEGRWEDVLADPKVVEHADQVRMNLELVGLRFMPTPDKPGLTVGPPALFRPTKPGDALHERMLIFLDAYGLATIKRKYLDGTLWSGATAKPVGRPLAPRNP